MDINENQAQANTQNARIAEYLLQGHSITQQEAYDLFQCFRLGARIFNLKERGMQIISERITTHTGKRVARYRLATPQQ